MSKLCELKGQILIDGEDLRLDDGDLARIRALLPADGPIEPEDMMALLQMRSEARVVSPAFDAFFFPVLKRFLLADGQVSLSEQFHLLRILYGGGGIDENERRFLEELRYEAGHVTPEFEALYERAMRD